MYKKVRAYIAENQMILPGDKVIAGVSGGGDSMTMLHVLAGLSREMGFALEAVHVHHGIRGKEADRDMALVEQACTDWNIPCRVYRFSVPELAKQWKMGLEETGRVVRRQAFAQEAGKFAGDGVRVRFALAHNKNDLAETMLHNLARGSALRGLTGILPVNGDIIRPVLCLERREIDHYLKEKGIPFVTDSSNLEDAYTRNRIRHHILPLLEKEINAGTVAHMAEASGLIAMADAFLSKSGAVLLDKFMQEEKSFLLTEVFFAQETILQYYAVMEALGRLAGRRKDVSVVHVRQVLKLQDKQTGRKISLPYGICARKEYLGVRVFPENEQRAASFSGMEWDLTIPGTLQCELGSFSTEIFPFFNQKISEKKYTKWLDYDKIEKNLCVRTRRPGDYLIINEEGCRKKISRCMIDDKIPGELREAVPLVACGEEILWMVGGRISEKYKVTSKTERILEVRYQGGYQDE